MIHKKKNWSHFTNLTFDIHKDAHNGKSIKTLLMHLSAKDYMDKTGRIEIVSFLRQLN